MSPVLTIKRKRGMKRATLRVKNQNQIQITAPYWIPKIFLERMFTKHKQWIEARLQEFSECPIYPPETALEAECLTYLGKNYSIRYQEGPSAQIEMNSESIIVIAPKTYSFEKKFLFLKAWFRTRAVDIFEDRVGLFADKFPRAPQKISIKDTKTRWGSCSSTGLLSFNIRLLCAPLDVIDGIVVHELCHLVHMNHSKAFWDLVYTVYPDYDHTKKWTRQHSALLHLSLTPPASTS